MTHDPNGSNRELALASARFENCVARAAHHRDAVRPVIALPDDRGEVSAALQTRAVGEMVGNHLVNVPGLGHASSVSPEAS